MSEKKIELALFSLIVSAGIFLGLALGFLSGKIFLTDLSSWRNDAHGYIATALELARNHRFNDGQSLFFGPFQKGPGYPLFLAAIFETIGESAVYIWIFHAAIWLFSLILLWKISRRFLPGRWALLPPLFTALYWGIAAYIIDVNSDLIALAFVVLFVWAFLHYQETRQLSLAVISGFSLGFLILIKPIVIYFVPIFIALWLIGVRLQSRAGRVFFSHLAIFLVIVLLLAGSWSYYNYKLIGTPQLASGGLTLMRRADDVLMSGERIVAFTMASAFGDFIADKFFQGYGAEPEPYTSESSRREKTYYSRQLPDKSNELQLQQEQYAQARRLILEHPMKFIGIGFIYLLRLNSPVNPQGAELIPTFVGTKSGVPDFVKILILVGIHTAWFLFLLLVAWTFFKKIQDWRRWGLILLLILYFNGMYALLTHSEARYILPVMPFYFLLFVMAITWKENL